MRIIFNDQMSIKLSFKFKKKLTISKYLQIIIYVIIIKISKKKKKVFQWEKLLLGILLFLYIASLILLSFQFH